MAVSGTPPRAPDARADELLAELAALARAVDGPDFGRLALRCVSRTCVLRNFSVYVVPDIRHPAPVMTMFDGDLGEYRIRRNSSESVKLPGYPGRIGELIRMAGEREVHMLRQTPDADDPRWPIYRRSGLIERVTSMRIDRLVAYNVNYYRSESDGPISDEEEGRLRPLLPLVNALVVLRHKILGLTQLTAMPARHQVTQLRGAGMPLFDALTARESEVCDGIVAGFTAGAIALELGISENTVRTMRMRAYRKLGIQSSSQLFALLFSARDTLSR
ncbi:MAG: helix-turn-helix transcriptional regulator [Rhizobiaceae bacterium]|nr:helix-turn-helix transcriptional regulator [Rhizobiaceae bacterium]